MSCVQGSAPGSLVATQTQPTSVKPATTSPADVGLGSGGPASTESRRRHLLSIAINLQSLHPSHVLSELHGSSPSTICALLPPISFHPPTAHAEDLS